MASIYIHIPYCKQQCTYCNFHFRIVQNDKEEMLKSIKKETLLIWGENDLWIPLDNGKRMNSLIKYSKLEVIKSSGHVPMEENPKESLDILNKFLNEY